MSDYDRGVYAPESDAPLAFDPRQTRRGPAPFSLIVSVMVLLVIVGGAYLFYRHGVRKAGETPQVVGAPIGETRTPPASGAQSSDESAGLQVYQTEAPSSAAAPASAPAFAPGPEQPQPLPAARPAPVAVAPLKGEAAPPVTAPPPVRVVQAPAPAAKPAPLKLAAAKPPVLRGPTTATADDASDDDTGAAATTRVAKTAPATADTGAGPGSALVQIGAFTDSAQADKTWGDVARAMPTQMHGKTRKVETTTKDGKTFFRAYVAGFASRADAASFCASLKAAGKPCFVK
jgi:hypothetical protein